jgi:hypothetical protein
MISCADHRQKGMLPFPRLYELPSRPLAAASVREAVLPGKDFVAPQTADSEHHDEHPLSNI